MEGRESNDTKPADEGYELRLAGNPDESVNGMVIVTVNANGSDVVLMPDTGATNT